MAKEIRTQTRQDRAEFARYVYGLLMERCKMPQLARLGAAASALETGWGRYVAGNNLFGIKPSGAQQHAPGRPEIRAYADPAQSVNSWVYLATGSSLYEEPRERLIKHLAALQERGDHPDVYRAAWECWFLDFAKIYCPANPKYGETVLSIAREQDAMREEGRG